MFFNSRVKWRLRTLALNVIGLVPGSAQANSVQYYGASEMLYLSGQIGVVRAGTALAAWKARHARPWRIFAQFWGAGTSPSMP